MKNTGKVVAIVLIIVLAVILLGSTGMMGVGGFGMMGPGMMGGYGGMMGGYNGYGGMMSGYGFNPLGTIVSLVVWVLVIGGIVLLVVWLVRNVNRGGLGIGSNESPLDILKARYAKGEITKEQFDTIRQDLST